MPSEPKKVPNVHIKEDVSKKHTAKTKFASKGGSYGITKAPVPRKSSKKGAGKGGHSPVYISKIGDVKLGDEPIEPLSPLDQNLSDDEIYSFKFAEFEEVLDNVIDPPSKSTDSGIGSSSTNDSSSSVSPKPGRMHKAKLQLSGAATKAASKTKSSFSWTKTPSPKSNSTITSATPSRKKSASREPSSPIRKTFLSKKKK